MTLTIIAAAAFVIGSIFDARSSMVKGVWEAWPLYRWPPWKKGPFRLWMYLIVIGAVLAIGITQQRAIEMFVLAGLRLFFGLYWNPKQAAKVKARKAAAGL